MPQNKIIGVHLDLKGVAFRHSYVPQLMKDLASQRVNTLLVEYEDVFPFDGMDIAADRKTLWSKRMLKEFLDAADANGIDVIPLQQCVGHFEYLLGWKKYRKLAEDQAYPSTIRVDYPKARAVVFNMLRQVIEAHPRSKYVHLGMDEAHGLFKGAKRMKRDFLELYLDYLGDLLEIVELYGKTPIIWSDMLEDHFRPDAFGKYTDRVIIMTWEYGKVTERSSMGRLAVGPEYAAPVGQVAWWVPNEPLQPAHSFAATDPRILADIMRRLRGETPFTTDPPSPLP